MKPMDTAILCKLKDKPFAVPPSLGSTISTVISAENCESTGRENEQSRVVMASVGGFHRR
jgi:hypothetical protein